jgi:hypothetical protein
MIKIPKSIVEKLLADSRFGGFERQGPDAQHYICAYRTHDGKACAIGCLISDVTYNMMVQNSLDGNNIVSIMKSERCPVVIDRIRKETGLDNDQLKVLQAAHDDCNARLDRNTVVRARFERLLLRGNMDTSQGHISLDINA